MMFLSSLPIITLHETLLADVVPIQLLWGLFYISSLDFQLKLLGYG